MRAVWSVFVPPWIPSSRSGRGTPSSSTNTVLSSSSWCWPVCTSSSSCAARSMRETAAALTNCGRFPMTVTTRNTAGGSACRRAELLRDVRAHALRGHARERPVDHRHGAAVDRMDRQDLAHRRGEERLAHVEQLFGGERALGHLADAEHSATGDRVEHVLVERRGHEGPAVERAEE